MNIEELVKMPEPWHNVTHYKVDVFTRRQLRTYGEAVAAAVAKRCADLCLAELVDTAATGCEDDLVYNLALGHAFDAIRREFG